MTRSYRSTGGVTIEYVKRRSSAVCAYCDWKAVSDGTEGIDLARLKRQSNYHAAKHKHRVVLTMTQDVFIEPRRAVEAAS